MLRINELRLPVGHTDKELQKKIAKLLNTDETFEPEILRRSLDARKKPTLYFNYVINIKVKNEEAVLRHADKSVIKIDYKEYEFPQIKASNNVKPIIAGFGPAGIFTALMLVRAGLLPIIYERGLSVDERDKDVLSFWESGILKENSNVQFGEGGAGTYSDGKLNTLIKDRDNKGRFVLKTFVEYGAPEKILYDAKPHIGTDILKQVVKNIRNDIIRLGGEIHFNSAVTDFDIKDGALNGIYINSEEYVSAPCLVLAIGHSARDTVKRLYERGATMCAKPFAVGLRVEHDADIINFSQYGDAALRSKLGNASYKLTHKCKSGRGVYTFCMCPGGYIVNASSEKGGIAVNGMSYSGRGADKSNSAVIASLAIEDFGGDKDVLAGLSFQRSLESAAYNLGNGAVPIESYGEYKSGSLYLSDNDIAALNPHIKGEFRHGEVHNILPDNIRDDFMEGMEAFGRKINGFNDKGVIIAGVETRTSSPVRILRDENFLSNTKGIYPVGEGAGYAGGIMSSAIDGINAAEAIMANEY